MSDSVPVQQLLNDWYYRVRESQFSHYGAARYYGKFHYYIGIPAVILSGIVGTSVFASLGKQADPTYTIIIGLVSVLITVLSSLQTFLRFSERAEKHRIAGARYGAIRREIEQAQASYSESDTNVKQFLDRIRERMVRLRQKPLIFPLEFG